MIYGLAAALGIAALSLIGSIFFGRSRGSERLGRFILPFAVGTFLSVAFFELIPETLHEAETYGPYAIAAGFIFFYALSHVVRTYHHHHDEHCEGEGTKAAASLVLIGDAIHNFADGIVIAAAFLVDPMVGLAAAVGIALHEIPQEIAEYAILIRAGYSRTKAALYNFISALSILAGVVVAYISLFYAEGLLGLLIGVAAGNLLYIAASDVIPELQNEHSRGASFWGSFSVTIVAMVIMGTLLYYGHENLGHDEEHEETEMHEEVG